MQIWWWNLGNVVVHQLIWSVSYRAKIWMCWFQSNLTRTLRMWLKNTIEFRREQKSEPCFSRWTRRKSLLLFRLSISRPCWNRANQFLPPRLTIKGLRYISMKEGAIGSICTMSLTGIIVILKRSSLQKWEVWIQKQWILHLKIQKLFELETKNWSKFAVQCELNREFWCWELRFKNFWHRFGFCDLDTDFGFRQTPLRRFRYC